MLLLLLLLFSVTARRIETCATASSGANPCTDTSNGDVPNDAPNRRTILHSGTLRLFIDMDVMVVRRPDMLCPGTERGCRSRSL